MCSAQCAGDAEKDAAHCATECAARSQLQPVLIPSLGFVGMSGFVGIC